MTKGQFNRALKLGMTQLSLGIAGGTGGAALGFYVGSIGGPVGSVLGTVVGGVLGGVKGQQVGTKLYQDLEDLAKARRLKEASIKAKKIKTVEDVESGRCHQLCEEGKEGWELALEEGKDLNEYVMCLDILGVRDVQDDQKITMKF